MTKETNPTMKITTPLVIGLCRPHFLRGGSKTMSDTNPPISVKMKTYIIIVRIKETNSDIYLLLTMPPPPNLAKPDPKQANRDAAE